MSNVVKRDEYDGLVINTVTQLEQINPEAERDKARRSHAEVVRLQKKNQVAVDNADSIMRMLRELHERMTCNCKMCAENRQFIERIYGRAEVIRNAK